MSKDTRPQVCNQNAETGELVYREMNEAEFAQYELDKAKAQKQNAEAEAKAQAKAALLARLGITEDEAKLLLGGN